MRRKGSVMGIKLWSGRDNRQPRPHNRQTSEIIDSRAYALDKIIRT